MKKGQLRTGQSSGEEGSDGGGREEEEGREREKDAERASKGEKKKQGKQPQEQAGGKRKLIRFHQSPKKLPCGPPMIFFISLQGGKEKSHFCYARRGTPRLSKEIRGAFSSLLCVMAEGDTLKT